MATPAAAALRLCNRTSYILYAASGTATGATVTTAGWTRLIPGGCATAIASDLGADTFVYARTSQAHNGPSHAWGGARRLCAKDTDFTLQTAAGANRCSGDAYMMAFTRLETGGGKDWTTTFTQSPTFATAGAARRAGLARLLADIGYHLGSAGREDLDRAIGKFRTRMKMTGQTGVSALFDALETDAMKVAAPDGYSICNDTDEALWAALGFRRGNIWVSRGWWQVAAGACARALTTTLKTDRVYLYVQRKNGTPLVTGKATFCVADITFDIEKRNDCKARSLTAAGFAATDTRGRSGFAAHIGEDGLLPPMHLPQ